MTYDASNRKDIRKAEKISRNAEAANLGFLREIMSGPGGRAWMHDFLASAGMFHEPFVPSNAYATAYNLGKASVAKPIWAAVFQHYPQQYILMMQEQEMIDNVRSTPDHPDSRPDDPTGTLAEPGRDDPGSIDDALDAANIGIVGADGIITWPR